MDCEFDARLGFKDFLGDLLRIGDSLISMEEPPGFSLDVIDIGFLFVWSECPPSTRLLLVSNRERHELTHKWETGLPQPNPIGTETNPNI